MNNTNKANNNSTSVKGKGENTKLNQQDKDTNNSGTAVSNQVNLSPTVSSTTYIQHNIGSTYAPILKKLLDI